MSGNNVIGNAAKSPDHFAPIIELALVTQSMRVAAPIALTNMEVIESETLSVIWWFSIFLKSIIKSRVAQQVRGSIAILGSVKVCRTAEQTRNPIVAAKEDTRTE